MVNELKMVMFFYWKISAFTRRKENDEDFAQRLLW
jgi:hypothetical protein